jgi:transposase
MTSPSCPRRTSPATATATRPIAPTPRPCSRPPGTRRSTESPVKSVEQQALSALHRLWQGYLQTRTARINAVRGLLREVGVTIPTGASYVLPRARAALADEPLPPYLCHALGEALEEIATLEARAQDVQDQLTHLAEQLPAVALLQGVPGVGILTATALVAFVGDIQRFRSGRDFAAYLGLTPREHSSGLARRLGGISKRGNRYVRMLLIHGARSALRAGHVTKAPDDLRTWALALERRKGHNVAAVALANKLARVGWRVWRDQRPFVRRDAAKEA